MRIGEAAAGQSADEVHRQGGSLVATQHRVRVGRSGRRSELGPVDEVAPVAGQRHTVAPLELFRPRFGVLARKAAGTDDSLLNAMGEDEAHVRQDLELVRDRR